MTRTRKLLALCALALAGTGLVAGCGGGGSDEDAKEALKETLTVDPEQVTEGVSSFSVSGSLEGSSGGDFSLDLNGPIRFSTEEQPGELDWTVDASASFAGLAALIGSDSVDIQGSLTLADEQLFVTYEDTSYVADKSLYQQIAPTLEGSLQITDAASGLTDEQAQEFVDSFEELSEEGSEEINGDPTTHYSGTLDAEALSNLNTEEGDPVQGQLEGVDQVEFDIWVGEEDDIARQVDLSFGLDLPEEASSAGFESLDLAITAGVSNLNESQTIEAPADPAPLDNLLDQLGIDPSQFEIPDVGGLGSGAAGDGGLGTPGGAASDPEVQECIANAADAEAITDCLDQ